MMLQNTAQKIARRPRTGLIVAATGTDLGYEAFANTVRFVRKIQLVGIGEERIADAVDLISRKEARIIEAANADDFDIEKLKQAIQAMADIH